MDARSNATRAALRQRLKVAALALLCSIVALIIAAVLFARHAQLVREATNKDVVLHEWQTQLQSVLISLTNAETAQRGYLLTGKDRYLAPYRAAVDSLPETFDALGVIPIPGNTHAGVLQNIQRQSVLKIAELDETIRLLGSGNAEAALAIVQTDDGQQHMEELRRNIQSLTDAATEYKNDLNASVVRGSVQTERWALISVVALILVVIMAALQTGMLVSAQSEHARALKELTDVYDHTPDYVAQTNWFGQMRYINPAALSALNLPADFDVSGHKFTDFYTGETNKRWMTEIIPAVKRDGVWVGETTVLLQGRSTPVNHTVIAHRNAVGRITRYSSIMRNISRQVASRQELARQTAALNAIVESIPAMVAVWDVGLRCLLVNRATERWLGRNRETLVDRKLEDIMPAAEFERSLPWFRRALAGETVVYEKEYSEATDVRHLSCTYTPMTLADGTVGGVISVAQNVTHEREEHIRLLNLSEHDPLTGLMNRSGFETYLARKANQGELASLALLYIDLDHFKPVNDRYGHAAGDEVLRQFGTRLQGVVRPTDAVARLGGDEFGVVIEGIRGLKDASAVADKVVALAQQPFSLAEKSVTIGASVGVALGTEATGWAKLVENADALAYEAKASGRGRSALSHSDAGSTTTVSKRLPA